MRLYCQETADLVNELREKGMSARGVAAHLNDLGVRTDGDRPIERSDVGNIVTKFHLRRQRKASVAGRRGSTGDGDLDAIVQVAMSYSMNIQSRKLAIRAIAVKWKKGTA